MDAAAEFWSTNYYGHPPLTDIALAKAEHILGVRLPAELVALLRVQNGGYTRGFIHPMKEPTTWAKDHVPLQDLAGVIVDPGHSSPMNLVRTDEMTREWGLPPRQVLLSGDGHYWITLDYRKGPNPSVAWIDVECGEDKQIAPSFKDFLANLLPEPGQDGPPGT
jgi:hypothetical protein